MQVPGFFPSILPCSLEAKVNQRGDDWLQFTQTFSLGSWPAYGAVPAGAATMERVSGPAQFNGLALPPGELGQLRPGQDIDRDDHTRVRTSVTHAGPAPGGGPESQ